jgi:hypothetical protein
MLEELRSVEDLTTLLVTETLFLLSTGSEAGPRVFCLKIQQVEVEVIQSSYKLMNGRIPICRPQARLM